MKNTTIAIDLAKSVFEVGISDRPGPRCRKPPIIARARSERSWPISRRRPSSWKRAARLTTGDRTFQSFGHEVKLLPPLLCAALRPAVQDRPRRRKRDAGSLAQQRYPAGAGQDRESATADVAASHPLRLDDDPHHADQFGPRPSAGIRHRLSAGCRGACRPRSGTHRRCGQPLCPCRCANYSTSWFWRSANWKVASKRSRSNWKRSRSQTPVVERLRTIPGIGLLTATALVGFIGDVHAISLRSSFRRLLG